jgi:hypothetical protein
LQVLAAAARACFDAFESPGAEVPPRYRFNPLSTAAILPSLLDYGCTGNDLLASLSVAGLDDLLRDALGGGPATCKLDESWVRKRYAPSVAPRWHHPNIWHQDGGLGVMFGADPLDLPGMTPLVTLWIPLQSCRGDCPALEFVARRQRQLRHYSELADDKLRRQFASEDFQAPALDFGDALLFLNGTLHRTWVTPEMTRNRLSVDYRFFPSATESSP